MEYSRAFLAYDTLCRIAADVPQGGRELLADCEEEAHALEKTLSMFDPDSELSQLCRRARPEEALPVSDTLWDFLAQNLEVCRLTDGMFDPTVGPLVKLWDFLAEEPEIPSEAAVGETLARVGYRHIHLDSPGKTVTFDIPGVVLDPGAAGKGFALGLAADRLRKAGAERAVLDYGGNLFVLGMCREPDGKTRPWKAAIRDPDDMSRVFGAAELQDAGIATSSWYEHSFQKDGRVYHHLLNPRTGYPMPLTLKSVSILSSRPVYTDLLSTAFFVLGEEKGRALVDRLRQDSGERIEYVAVREDGTLAVSASAAFTPYPVPG